MTSIQRLDALALSVALRRPRIVADFSSLLSGLSGAGSAGSQASGQYQQAANQSNTGYNKAITGSQDAYQQALQDIQNTTQGPQATNFVDATVAAAQPEIAQTNQGILADEAASGTLTSGAGRQALANAGGQEAAGLAGAIAPFYSQAASAYDSTAAGGAGATSSLEGSKAGSNSNLLGSGAGAYNTAYNNAQQQFLGALQAAGAAAAGGIPTSSALPSTGTPGTPDPSTYDYSYGGQPTPGTDPFTDALQQGLTQQQQSNADVPSLSGEPNYNPYASVQTG